MQFSGYNTGDKGWKQIVCSEWATCLLASHVKPTRLKTEQNHFVYSFETHSGSLLGKLLYTSKYTCAMLLLCEYTIVYQCSVDYAFVYQCSVSMLLYTSKYYKCNAASVAKRMQPPDYLLLNTPAVLVQHVHKSNLPTLNWKVKEKLKYRLSSAEYTSPCTNQIFQHSTEKLKKSWSTDYPPLNTPARAQIKSSNTQLKS